MRVEREAVSVAMLCKLLGFLFDSASPPPPCNPWASPASNPQRTPSIRQFSAPRLITAKDEYGCDVFARSHQYNLCSLCSHTPVPRPSNSVHAPVTMHHLPRAQGKGLPPACWRCVDNMHQPQLYTKATTTLRAKQVTLGLHVAG